MVSVLKFWHTMSEWVGGLPGPCVKVLALTHFMSMFGGQVFGRNLPLNLFGLHYVNLLCLLVARATRW